MFGEACFRNANSTYEAPDTQTEELQQKNRPKTTTKNKQKKQQFYSHETSPLNLTQIQITNICSVRIGVLYLVCETAQWNTYNQKHCDERKAKVSFVVYMFFVNLRH